MQSPNIPLAERVRPQTLAEFVGQDHLVGQDGVIRKVLETNIVPSMIFWGPPGVGKTTLAGLIAKSLKRPFTTLSAISAGVKEVREVIQKARQQRGAVLIIDEIHRFNKAQQDALLGAIEQGVISLIGATTENPSFEVNPALLSRSQVFVLRPLTLEQMQELIHQALRRDFLLSKSTYQIEDWDMLFRLSDGDGRRALNLLELAIGLAQPDTTLTHAHFQQAAQQQHLRYDKSGEMHYDIISAFIKSIRGSDPNAAVYWLARMIEAGEEPRFIARRLVILASEDIGNANPTALVLATSAMQAVQQIGWPESRIILSQATIYLATSNKSNAAYTAIANAQAEVRHSGNLPVPMHIRNAPTKLMKDLGYNQGYQYSHDYPGNFSRQEYLPDQISGTTFYQPGQNPREAELRRKLQHWWEEHYGY